MRTRSPVPCHGIGPIVLTTLELLAIIGAPISRAVPQSAATGALIALDPTGKGIPGASVELKNQEMATSRSTVSDEEGRFVFTLLPPGTYQVTAQKDGYSQAQSSVTVSITETARLSSKLVALPWPREGSSLEFRAEFFNTLKQFANPDANSSSATYRRHY